MNESLTLTNRAVTAGEEQANTSEISARATEISAQATKRSAEMARVGLLPKLSAELSVFTLQVGKKVEVQARVWNRGNTRAFNVTTEMHIIRFIAPLSQSYKPRELPPPSLVDLASQSFLTAPLTSSDIIEKGEIDLIVSGQRQFRIWLWGRYDDEFGGRNLPFFFCWAFSKTHQGMVACNHQQYAEYDPN